MNIFNFLLFMTSIAAGAVASVTGFGIGSILTPLLALQVGTKLAVAAISIPHLIATTLRFWFIRHQINRSVLFRFGIASAIGGLIGAVLHSFFQSSFLTLVFGLLLIFAGFMGCTGLAQKLRLSGPLAWIAGALSGGFGGLVGNQGGIRSAALMTFDLPKESLVATATATGIIVDLARMPIYLMKDRAELASIQMWIVYAIVGVVLGTVLGTKFLKRISEPVFRKILGAMILLLGIYMLTQAQR